MAFEKAPQIFEIYEQCMVEVSPLLFLGIFNIPRFTSFPIPSLIQRRKAQDKLRTIMTQIIHDKLASQSSDKPKDLLDMILPFATTADAISHTLTFVLAGYDASTHTLGFVFGMLPSHPQAVAGIRAEYNKVIEKYGSLSSWEAVAELTYTQAVIHETLRVNSVVYAILQRVAVGDDTVPMSDGPSVFIPKGTVIQVNMAVMSCNPKYWTNPESFCPDRFMEGTAEWKADLALRGGKSHSFYFMPFSAGSKGCIGQRFAMGMIQLATATLVGKYDFSPTSEMNVRQAFSRITTGPVNIEMTLRRVKAPSASNGV
ncbi:unnamed protein product [Aphanomyces euteiches]